MGFIQLKNNEIFSSSRILPNIYGQLRIGLFDIDKSKAEKVFSNKNFISKITVLDDNKKETGEVISGYNNLITVITINLQDDCKTYIDPKGKQKIAKIETYVFLDRKEE